MSSVLTVSAITATGCTIAFTNMPGGGSVEIQIADNPEFRGLVSWNRYTVTPTGVGGLNQLGTYYARGRTVTGGGALGAWGATVGFYTTAGVAWSTAPQNVLLSPGLVVPPVPILNIVETTNAAVAGYPMTNLLRDDPNLIAIATPWASGTGTDQVAIDFDTAGGPIDTIALLDANFPETVLIQVLASTTAARRAAGNSDIPGGAFTGPTYTRASANLPQRRGYHALIRSAVPVALPYWRVYVYVPTGTWRQGQFMARYLVAGLARTSKNITTDKTETPLDLGAMDRTRGGGPNRVWGFKMRKIDFEISVMSEMQWETQYGDLWRKIGLSEPVLIVPNSKTGAFLHDRILYGTVTQQRATQVNSPIFTHGFSCESLI